MRHPDACERWRPCTKHSECQACDRCGLNPTFHAPAHSGRPEGGS